MMWSVIDVGNDDDSGDDGDGGDEHSNDVSVPRFIHNHERSVAGRRRCSVSDGETQAR